MNQDLELLLAQLELLRNRIVASLDISLTADEVAVSRALKTISPTLLSPLEAEVVYFFTTVAKNNEAWSLQKILCEEAQILFTNPRQVSTIVKFLNDEISKTKRYLFELEAQPATELPRSVPANLPELVRNLEEHHQHESEQRKRWRQLYEGIIDTYNQRIIQGLSPTLPYNIVTNPAFELVAWKIVETAHESYANQTLP